MTTDNLPRTKLFAKVSMLNPLLVDCMLNGEKREQYREGIAKIVDMVSKASDEATESQANAPASLLFRSDSMVGPLLRWLVDERDQTPEDLNTVTAFLEAARTYIREEEEAAADAAAAQKAARAVVSKVTGVTGAGGSDKKTAAVQKDKQGAWGIMKKQTTQRIDFLHNQKLGNLLEKVLEEARCESLLLIPA
eukprot:7314307-Prymnesium_polylepis.1